MSEPVGYLLTWTCYGTWLPGDERRSVDKKHNTYGTPRAPVDPARVAGARQRQTHRTVVLAEEARAIVADTIAAHCQFRGWALHAVNARSNHVHVVVGYAGQAPEKVMGEFKCWCSRRLHETGALPNEGQVWTDHGSTVYLWNPRDIAGAVEYVDEGQGPERFGR